MSHLPTPEATDSSGSHRRRRAEASSSDESALGTFAISNLRDRVVTPPRPLPLESYGPRDGTEARRAEILFGDEFERKAVELAREQSIPELVAVSLTERYFRDDPQDTQATVLIAVNEWTPECRNPWEAVVRKLKLHIGIAISVF